MSDRGPSPTNAPAPDVAPKASPSAAVPSVPVTGATRPPPPDPFLPLAPSEPKSKSEIELAKGDAAYRAKAWKDARAAYGAAKTLAPKAAAPIVGLARTALAEIDLPEDFAAGKGNKVVAAVARDLQKAVELEATSGIAWVEKGRVLLLAGDADQALRAAKRGAELLPDAAEAQSALGIALLATGRPAESVEPLTTASRLEPDSPARLGNLGTVLFMTGKVDEAVSAYDRAVRLDPTNARTRSDLGTALLASNDLARGTRELEEAVRLDERRATFRSNLGYAYQLQNRFPEAIAKYREAIALDATLASAWINLATALSADPKTRAEARAALLRAKAIDPTDPRVKANLDELDALERAH
ncbi:MAG: tetratricopeptide repeat protein [Polyangiaceae bacterium]